MKSYSLRPILNDIKNQIRLGAVEVARSLAVGKLEIVLSRSEGPYF